jgi:hypothetical protein
MRKHAIQTVYRKLLRGAESVLLLRPQRRKTRPARFPLIDSKGPKVELTSDRLYELIEFP